MKRILSVQYSDAAFNLCMLVIRVCFGLLIIIRHGMPLLMDFSSLQNNFYSFMGMGSEFSLILAIFAEVFCGIFIILGLFTRFAVLPLIITMLVVVFGANAGKTFPESELALLYLSVFLLLLFCGPGKVSVDNMIN